MVINGQTLLQAKPIRNMETSKIYEGVVTFGLSEAGYDIRLKQEINFTRDLFLRRCVERIDYDDNNKRFTEREPGKFIIASSIEQFEMPMYLMGEVKDKSSWARKGLSVFNTVIEPGWKGYLTLELVYYGWRDLHIPAGSGIAQVIFYQVSDPNMYVGRYQNQANRPVPAIQAVVPKGTEALW